MSKPITELPVIQLDLNEYGAFSDMGVKLARAAAEHGPIFRRQAMSGFQMVHMVGPEANKFVLHTHREHFSHDQGWTPILGDFFGKGLLNMDGAEWQQHRKMMNPAFTIAYMAKYLPIMNRVIQTRTSDWLKRGEVDLYVESREIAFDVAAEALAGLTPGPMVDRLREMFYAILHANYDDQNETFEQFIQRMAPIESTLHQMIIQLIEEKRKHPTDDVLGMLVRARDENGEPLSVAQMLAHVIILLIAGHETTTTLAAWLLYLLAIHPDYLARVHAELDSVLAETNGEITLDAVKAMSVLGNAVNESGRLHSPVVNAPRGVVKEFEFGGYTIPAGTFVMYSIAAGHRLPDVFEKPDIFDPDRFAKPREEDKRTPYSLVTFGGGPRICIGINMAQIEIKAFAAHVLRSFTLEPLDKEEIINATYGITSFPQGGIHVRVKPRAS